MLLTPAAEECGRSGQALRLIGAAAPPSSWLFSAGDASERVRGPVRAPRPAPGAPTEAGADRAERLLAGLNEPQRRGGRPRRGPAAGPRRRRLGQDPRPDPPHRLPAGDRRGAAGRDPRDHLHQQGGERDARAGRGSDRALGAGDVGDHLPLGLRTDAARRRRAARLLAQLHDLRRVRLAADAQTLHERAGGRPKRYPPRAIRLRSRAPRTSWSTPRPSAARRQASSRKPPPILPLYEKRMLEANAMDFDDLLVRTVNVLELSEEVASAGAAPSATSSSTSTRTPTTPSTGCCSCSPRSTAT